jgi:hypothetical protein
MQEEILTEFFSIPVGLKKIVKVSGVDLYTSDSLVKNFKKFTTECPVLQSFSDKINLLVDRGRIIPCYINKGIVKVFLWKILSNRSGSHDLGNTLAFHHSDTGNVYILIDNNISFAGHINDEFLGKLTIHECTHMAGQDNKKGFSNLFLKDLTKFYSYYFKALFELKDISEKDVSKYVSMLLVSDRVKEILDKTGPFLDSLKESYEYTDDEFNKLKYDYLRVLKFTMTVPPTSNFFTELSKQKEIIITFYSAYKAVFGILSMYLTFRYQELYDPIEVICSYFDVVFPKEKILSMLSLIK